MFHKIRNRKAVPNNGINILEHLYKGKSGSKSGQLLVSTAHPLPAQQTCEEITKNESLTKTDKM